MPELGSRLPPSLLPCDIRGACHAEKLVGAGRCFAHVTSNARAAVLERIRQGGPVNVAKGVTFSAELLDELLAALPRDDEDHYVFRQADFYGATLPGIKLVGARFDGRARFEGTNFVGGAVFDRACFHGSASFGEAGFGCARFDGARFPGDAWFRKASFQQEASFDNASFQRDASFDGAAFHSDVSFGGARFPQARDLGPVLVRGRLTLEDAVFDQPVRIQAAAAVVDCSGARFSGGAQLRLRYAAVALADANLAEPVILAGVPPFPGVDDADLAHYLEWPASEAGAAWRPRLLSVERADVAGLHLADTDLRACRFSGAQNLDRMRIEGVPLLARPPGPWRARRVTVAEEHQWRSELGERRRDRGGYLRLDQPNDRGWYPSACQPPTYPLGLIREAPVVEPVRIAAVYRELRKGREDAKDEPGAADFYYGEMEMRRHSPTAPAAERAILTLYWLASGYGLRAWRALTALALVIGLVGVAFSQVGFHRPHPSLAVGWLYALQATVSLEGKARQLSGQLTLPGGLLRVGLRLSGPVLLGLALLSIRNRVKR